MVESWHILVCAGYVLCSVVGMSWLVLASCVLCALFVCAVSLRSRNNLMIQWCSARENVAAAAATTAAGRHFPLSSLPLALNRCCSPHCPLVHLYLSNIRANRAINRPRHVPYDGLTLAMGKQAGDYRRVGPECWDQLMRLYGGGPAIYVDGPPVEDLSRCMLVVL